MKLEDRVGRTLGTRVVSTVLLNFRSDPLGYRVEWGEFVSNPATLKHLLRFREVLRDVRSRYGKVSRTDLKPNNCNFIDGVKTLDIVRGREDSNRHEPVGVDVRCDVRVIEGQLVCGKSTGLVGTKDINTRKRLNGGELLDDGLSTRKIGSTNSEGGRGDNWETNGHANYEEDKRIDEQVVVLWLGDFDVAEESADPGHENERDDQDEEAESSARHRASKLT